MNNFRINSSQNWWKLLRSSAALEGHSIDTIEKKQVNFMAFCWMPVMLGFALFCFSSNQWDFGLLMFILLGMQLLVVMFNYIGKNRLGNFIYLLVVNVLVLIMNAVFEFQYSTFFYFFPLFTGIFFLFSWKTEKRIYILMIIIMLMIHLYSFIFILNVQSTKTELYARELFNVFNFCASLLLTFLFFWRLNVLKSLQWVEINRIILDNQEKQLLLEETIKERNVLLSEIHHRTKNNFAIISSMLQLQRHHVSDPIMKNILLDFSSRVHSMAKVHHKLYERKDFAKIDFKDYLEDLIEDLKSTIFPKEIPIEVQVDIDSFAITSDKAIPFSLIMNEILTNSIKYAFGPEGGKITIKISRIAKHVLVMIHDNGQGFDLELAQQKGSLGLTLIEALNIQLDGRFEFNTSNGTTFTMNFSLI